MANTFKNVQGDVAATATTLYTAPASTTSIVLACRITNVTDSTSTEVNVDVTDDSASTTKNLANNAPVPPGSTLVLEKIVLETSDALKATADDASTLEFNLAILEIT